jgi:carbamoylphosphate synthase small subunit
MRIALSQQVFCHNNIAYDATEHGWYDLLKNQELFFVPNNMTLDFEKLADYVDVFIITGGDNNELRRSIEIKFTTAMTLRNKPVIGICHGAFLITELLGGTVEEVQGHTETIHNLIYGNRIVAVNSFHNKAITKLHPSGIPLCVDEQGNVEAFIDGKLAGVLWHPERMPDPWFPTEILDLLG